MDTSVRLLRLLSLLQARGFWPGAELAERLEVTPRTLRRDVDRLRSLGYPVRSSSGVAGGYQLGAGASLPPLLLDDDEAIAVALALRTAAAGTVVGMEEVAVRTLAKLEQVLPARLRQRVNALHDAIVPLYFAGPRVEPRLLSTLAGASRNHERASFRYGDIEGRVAERTTEPHGLVHAGSRWYLAAWDESRADWRTFRVDRILGDVTLGSRFVPREVPHGDLAAYVSNSVASRPYPFRARVVFHA
ncbi:MAG TPA: WYL domain-containing protein, partial [Enhygromyxa sp.]|nr:WYL domain-containing protein [Enhygromyxa sp.]